MLPMLPMHSIYRASGVGALDSKQEYTVCTDQECSVSTPEALAVGILVGQWSSRSRQRHERCVLTTFCAQLRNAMAICQVQGAVQEHTYGMMQQRPVHTNHIVCLLNVQTCHRFVGQ